MGLMDFHLQESTAEMRRRKNDQKNHNFPKNIKGLACAFDDIGVL